MLAKIPGQLAGMASAWTGQNFFLNPVRNVKTDQTGMTGLLFENARKKGAEGAAGGQAAESA